MLSYHYRLWLDHFSYINIPFTLTPQIGHLEHWLYTFSNHAIVYGAELGMTAKLLKYIELSSNNIKPR